MAEDGGQSRAAAYVDAQFQERQRAQGLEHARQERKMMAYHKGQLQTFAQNRETAELRHAQVIRRLDAEQQREGITLAKQQSSIGGKLAGLTKAGRAKQQGQQEALTEKYDTLRMQQHRNLEALKERQFAAEQKDRLSRAREMKVFRQDHQDARKQQAQQHHATRSRQIEDRTQIMKRVEQQSRQNERQNFNEQSRGRKIAR